MKIIRTTFIVLVISLFAALRVEAATDVVTSTADDGSPGTLRTVIGNAASGDTIIFTNTLSGQTILLTNGQIVLSNNLTIDGSALPNQIQVSGNGATRIFQVNSNTSVVLNSIVLTNGNSISVGGGGSILAYGPLTLSNCIISANMGGGTGGGGIYSSGGPLTMNSCIVANNQSGGLRGGGIYNASGSITLNNCRFVGNSTLTPGAGGGIFNNSGYLTVNSCAFSSNRCAGNYGGGICSYDSMIVSNSAFVGNQALYGEAGGGGIYVNPDQNTIIKINNSTFLSNVATGSGGAVLCVGFGALISSCTIIGNQAFSGGGLTDAHGLTNCIVCGNSASVSPDIYGSYTGISNLIGTNAMLAPLGYYGGPTQTMPPLPGSPAINAGSVAAASGLTTDQRGFPRVVNNQVDIGAVQGIFNPAGPGPLTNLTILSNGSLQFSFTNYTGMTQTVLSSTNADAPLNTWTVLGTASEYPIGFFQFTDSDAPNHTQRFYRVRSP